MTSLPQAPLYAPISSTVGNNLLKLLSPIPGTVDWSQFSGFVADIAQTTFQVGQGADPRTLVSKLVNAGYHEVTSFMSFRGPLATETEINLKGIFGDTISLRFHDEDGIGMDRATVSKGRLLATNMQDNFGSRTVVTESLGGDGSHTCIVDTSFSEGVRTITDMYSLPDGISIMGVPTPGPTSLPLLAGRE